jgi:hypothetical protein
MMDILSYNFKIDTQHMLTLFDIISKYLGLLIDIILTNSFCFINYIIKGRYYFIVYSLSSLAALSYAWVVYIVVWRNFYTENPFYLFLDRYRFKYLFRFYWLFIIHNYLVSIDTSQLLRFKNLSDYFLHVYNDTLLDMGLGHVTDQDYSSDFKFTTPAQDYSSEYQDYSWDFQDYSWDSQYYNVSFWKDKLYDLIFSFTQTIPIEGSSGGWSTISESSVSRSTNSLSTGEGSLIDTSSVSRSTSSLYTEDGSSIDTSSVSRSTNSLYTEEGPPIDTSSVSGSTNSLSTEDESSIDTSLVTQTPLWAPCRAVHEDNPGFLHTTRVRTRSIGSDSSGWPETTGVRTEISPSSGNEDVNMALRSRPIGPVPYSGPNYVSNLEVRHHENVIAWGSTNQVCEIVECNLGKIDVHPESHNVVQTLKQGMIQHEWVSYKTSGEIRDINYKQYKLKGTNYCCTLTYVSTNRTQWERYLISHLPNIPNAEPRAPSHLLVDHPIDKKVEVRVVAGYLYELAHRDRNQASHRTNAWVQDVNNR